MAIPFVGNGYVANALTATFTKEFGVNGDETSATDGGVVSSIAAAARYARSVLISIVGASTPSWTVDIKGKLHEKDTYTNWSYQQVLSGDGPQETVDNQLSVTDTTLRFYRIVDPPPFLEVVATRTTGSITIFASVSSEPADHAEPKQTARGSLLVEGPAADGAAVAGNPVRIAGKDSAGNTQDVTTDTTGNQIIVGDTAEGTASPSTSPIEIAGEDDASKVRRAHVSDDGDLYTRLLGDLPATERNEVVRVAVSGTFTTAIQLTALDFPCADVIVAPRNRNTDAQCLIGDIGSQLQELKKGDQLHLGSVDPRAIYLKAHTTAGDAADGILVLRDRPAFRELLRRLISINGGWYLPCSERSGTAIADLGARQSNFTLAGATLLQAGVFGLGIDYDASGDYLLQAAEKTLTTTMTLVRTDGSATLDDSGGGFTAHIRDGRHWVMVRDTGSSNIRHAYIGTADVDGDGTKVALFNSPARTTQSLVEGSGGAWVADEGFQVYSEGAFSPSAAFTVGAWVDPDAFTAIQQIICKDSRDSGFVANYNKSFNLEITTGASGAIPRPLGRVYSAGVATTVTAVEELKANRHYFLVFKYVPSTGMYIYVNGRLDTSNTTSIPASIDDAAIAMSVGLTGIIGGAGAEGLNGRISHPFMIPANLNDNMIRTLYELSRR